MTLYRIDWAVIAEDDGGTVPRLVDRRVLVEVEPVETQIMCDECDGTWTRQGFIGSSGCSVCDERGFIVARVVVVEDTE